MSLKLCWLYALPSSFRPVECNLRKRILRNCENIHDLEPIVIVITFEVIAEGGDHMKNWKSYFWNLFDCHTFFTLILPARLTGR